MELSLVCHVSVHLREKRSSCPDSGVSREKVFGAFKVPCSTKLQNCSRGKVRQIYFLLMEKQKPKQAPKI